MTTTAITNTTTCDPLIAVVGPTATGKSDLALALAERLGGEVINADASQLYRGMDVGTAKLTLAERRGVPHHQLDVLDVRQEAAIAGYQAAARTDIDAVHSRGNQAVLVGGSGLYVRAAVDVLEIPPADPAIRARLEHEHSTHGADALRARLAAADPVAAANIQPNNIRRIIRALEVLELTGTPFSATMPRREFVRPTVLIGLDQDSTALDRRIADRVDAMLEAGLLHEVQGLIEVGLRQGRTASAAIGYAQMIDHLDGLSTLEQAREAIVTATRRLVRRQRSWFRADPRIHWLAADDPGLIDAAREVLDRAGRGQGTIPE